MSTLSDILWVTSNALVPLVITLAHVPVRIAPCKSVGLGTLDEITVWYNHRGNRSSILEEGLELGVTKSGRAPTLTGKRL